MVAKGKKHMDDSSERTQPGDRFDVQEFLDSLAMPTAEEGTASESFTHDVVPHGERRIAPIARPRISALDVAEYILRKRGRMTTMKLQKLVYYSQAWSLVWDESPLFFEEIQAWANGPVIRELFNYHRGMFELDHVRTGNPELLTQTQRDTVKAVLEFYGDKSAQWLIDLSHDEDPWQQARRGLPDTARGARSISLASMADYYSSLPDE